MVLPHGVVLADGTNTAHDPGGRYLAAKKESTESLSHWKREAARNRPVAGRYQVWGDDKGVVDKEQIPGDG
jgi:hypothetical protein